MNDFFHGIHLTRKYPQCVNSGYCCRKGPCQFGEMKEDNSQCRYLNSENKCDRYDWIKQQPGNQNEPAFGTGCCSGLNSDRYKILVELDKKFTVGQENLQSSAEKRPPSTRG